MWARVRVVALFAAEAPIEWCSWGRRSRSLVCVTPPPPPHDTQSAERVWHVPIDSTSLIRRRYAIHSTSSTWCRGRAKSSGAQLLGVSRHARIGVPDRCMLVTTVCLVRSDARGECTTAASLWGTHVIRPSTALPDMSAVSISSSRVCSNKSCRSPSLTALVVMQAHRSVGAHAFAYFCRVSTPRRLRGRENFTHADAPRTPEGSLFPPHACASPHGERGEPFMVDSTVRGFGRPAR